MLSLISSAKTLEKEILRCLKSYEHLSFAVAWASSGTSIYNAIIESKIKIKKAVIGTHFFQTDPKVLDDFIASRQVRFMLQPNGVFHPKTLVFWKNNKWEAFVGSANLTYGAITKNTELTVHVRGDNTDTSLRDEIKQLVSAWFNDADEMTAEKAKNYRLARPPRVAALERASGQYGSNPFKSVIASSIMTKSWETYAAEIMTAAGNDLEARLRVLTRAREAFHNSASFSDIDQNIRNMIAGLPSDIEPAWGWFGSMIGAGKFWTAMSKHLDNLSDALDFIPLGGDVTRIQYDSYLTEYKKAFPEGRHGIGTATRLLALKRPDQFICLDKANKRKLCLDFGITQHSINYDSYWDAIIMRIRDAPWWLASPLSDKNLDIWNGRTALLDVIFYEPT